MIWDISPLTMLTAELKIIVIFTIMKLWHADAIHNFKWVKIILMWQQEGQWFRNLADWYHGLTLSSLKTDM